jgi:ATP-binding cassette subfamily B protein
VQLAGGALSTLALCGAVAALTGLLLTGRIEPAAAGTAVVALRTAAGALTTLTRAAARIFRAGLFLDDWAAFLLEAAHHRIRRGTRGLPELGPDVIRAHGVTFTYPGTDRPAVTDVNLDLKRGEVVALVGENGSGKTTLVHLLTGLYLPDTGTITWDGTDLADADPATVWSQVAMTPQNYTRWPLTARENITLGRPHDSGDQAVLDAARSSGADHVLNQLPHGLDTSLARSFHADTPLHVFDEPTAALDARAERQVFNQFKHLAQGRTALVITHRLTNARCADRVVVMDTGRIVEAGTYEELLRRPGGLFAELHRLQEGTDQ